MRAESQNMGRLRTLLAATLALLALGGLGPATAPAGGPGTAVGVGEGEFHLGLYRRDVPVGLVRFNASNLGEDTHNLVVMSPRGKAIAVSPDIRAGQRHTVTVALRRPGTYRLVCTKADHARLGMRATLRVRRAR